MSLLLGTDATDYSTDANAADTLATVKYEYGNQYEYSAVLVVQVV